MNIYGCVENLTLRFYVCPLYVWDQCFIIYFDTKQFDKIVFIYFLSYIFYNK